MGLAESGELDSSLRSGQDGLHDRVGPFLRFSAVPSELGSKSNAFTRESTIDGCQKSSGF